MQTATCGKNQFSLTLSFLGKSLLSSGVKYYSCSCCLYPVSTKSLAPKSVFDPSIRYLYPLTPVHGHGDLLELISLGERQRFTLDTLPG